MWAMEESYEKAPLKISGFSLRQEMPGVPWERHCLSGTSIWKTAELPTIQKDFQQGSFLGPVFENDYIADYLER